MMLFNFLEKSKQFFYKPKTFRHQKSLLTFYGTFLIIGSLIAAAISFTILVGATPIRPDFITTTTLVVLNLFFILSLVFFILREISRIRLTRRQEKAASHLHVRIVAFFALFAAVPAVMVALVAAITLHIGLDRWFEIRTRTIISYSLSIADAYVLENARNLQGTALSMAYDLDNQKRLYKLDQIGFIEFMSQQAVERSLNHAALIRPDGSLIIKAYTDASFPLPVPPHDAVEAAASGFPALIEPKTRNIMGAIIKLKNIENAYLYTVRLVDPEVIKARQIVHANIDEYQGMEKNRIASQLAFALPYMSLALMIVLSAIWTGIALADRLISPIRQLIAAATQVSKGNLEVSVPVSHADGDIAVLEDTFNKMTCELQSQRHELLTAKDMIDERRRFSEAVLSGVTAGVIGVDAQGFVTIINPSAESILSVTKNNAIGKQISSVFPYSDDIFNSRKKSGRAVYRDQVTFMHKGEERTFNIQVTTESSAQDNLHSSYVITFDDITDLLQAQRSNAWSDIARRIAHEIKNPLTPIQLAAERIRRRYRKACSEDLDVFDTCIDTIIRQVEDIGRMVSEFSSFARMPKPEMKTLDLRDALREASFLIGVTRQDILFYQDFEEKPLMGVFDNRLLAQAFANLIKNAAESIDTCQKNSGIIRIRARCIDHSIYVDIIDNGKGLPPKNRQKLLEPYVTTREKGTGLGFSIVQKIIEEHSGLLELHDSPAEFGFETGAMVRVILPALVNNFDLKGTV